MAFSHVSASSLSLSVSFARLLAFSISSIHPVFFDAPCLFYPFALFTAIWTPLNSITPKPKPEPTSAASFNKDLALTGKISPLSFCSLPITKAVLTLPPILFIVSMPSVFSGFFSLLLSNFSDLVFLQSISLTFFLQTKIYTRHII